MGSPSFYSDEISCYGDFSSCHSRLVLSRRAVKVGLERYMVSPLRVETIIEEDRGKQACIKREAGVKLVNDLPGREIFFMGIGSGQIEIELIERRLGHEFGAMAESFQIKEFIFDEAMDGFDIALISVSAGRDALVLGTEVSDGGGEAGARTIFLKLADKFPSVVSLPGEVSQVDAATLQVGLDALSKQDAGGRGSA